MPLGAGTNWLTLTAVDAWDNVAVTNIMVVKSDLTLAIDPVAGEQLQEPTVTVSGGLSSSGYTVWVNGVKATDNGDGTWTADNVPLPEGGTAVLQVRAISNSDNGGNGTGGSGGSAASYNNPGNPDSAQAHDREAAPEKTEGIYVASDEDQVTWTGHYTWTDGIDWEDIQQQMNHDAHWSALNGGSAITINLEDWASSLYGGGHQECQTVTTWPPSLVSPGYQVVAGQCDTFEGAWPVDPITFCPQHCEAHPPPRYELWIGADAIATLTQTQDKSARTTLKLRTGGKRVPGRRNLWVLTGGAAEVLNAWETGPCAPDVDKRAVDPARETVMLGELGKLGGDGRLYVALPDGVEKDVTPLVKGLDYYTFSVNATKHRLVHQTQCVALTNPRTDRTRLGVGEYVNFSFDPGLAMNPPEQPVWQAFGGTVSPAVGTATTYTAPTQGRKSAVLVNVRDAVIVTEFDVVEPSGVDHAVVWQTNQLGVGAWGASAYLRVFIAPTDVSFSRVEIQEGQVSASDVWGRYTEFPYDNPENIDHDLGVFGAISCDNRWNAYGNPEGDWIQASMVPPQYAGGFTWPIPARWRIPGGPTNSLSNWSPQVVTVNSNGVTRITKFGIWVERTTNDVYEIGP